MYVSEIHLYFSSSEEINIGIKGPKGRQKEEDDKGLKLEGREMEDLRNVEGRKLEGKMYVYCTSFDHKKSNSGKSLGTFRL